MEAEPAQPNDSYVSGVGGVIAVWWILGLLGWLAVNVVMNVIEHQMLLIVMLCLSASVSPLYGLVIYSRARRRRQRRSARGAVITAALLFVIGSGCAIFLYYMFKALEHLR